MPEDTEPLGRRSFVQAAAAGSIASMTAAAGCLGDDDDDEAGGDRLPTITYYNNPEDYHPARHDAINLIAENITEAGIDCEVEVLEWGTLFESVNDQHDFNLTTWSRGVGPDPGQRLHNMFHSSNTAPGEGNFMGYENSELDPLLDEQLAETDLDERIEILHEIQEIIAEDVPMYPFRETPETLAYNNEQVSGWVDHPQGYNSRQNMLAVDIDNEDDMLVGVWTEGVETLSPLGHSNQQKVEYNLWLLFDYLVDLDSELELDPDSSIAQSIERPDPESAIVEIRTDGVFHDGEPVTAEDVAFSYNVIVEEEIPAFSAEADLLDEVEVVDDETVEFHLAETLAPFEILLGTRIPIVPQHVWEDVDEPGTEHVEEPVGSGPFELDYWEQDTELMLERNDDHYLANEFSFERRLWRIIPSTSTIWQTLRDGELNYYPATQPDRQLAESQDDEQISVAETQGDGWWFVGMNTDQEGLDDRAVRQAIAHSIPQTAIVEQITHGFGGIGHAVIPSGLGPMHNEDVRQYNEGAEHARERLEEAGYVFEDGMAHYSD